MNFVAVIALLLVGGIAGCVPLLFALENVAFKIPYAWRLNKQNALSRDYTMRITSRYRHLAWFWFAVFVVPTTAGIICLQDYLLFIPVFLGAGYAFAHVVLGDYPSDGERRAFIGEHITELLASGWWSSAEEAASELIYNAEIDKKLQSGEWLFWWPGRK